MSLTMKDSGNGDFELVPAGTHLGICYLVADIGRQETNFGVKEKVVIAWELPTEIMHDGRPFGVSKMYTASLNEKANLRGDLESWRSKRFTDAELAGFSLTNILGKPCLLTVVHNAKGDRTYANIASVTAVPKGMPVPERVNPLVSYDMDSSSQADYEKLPEWIRKKVDAAIIGNHAGAYDGRQAEPEFDQDVPF